MAKKTGSRTKNLLVGFFLIAGIMVGFLLVVAVATPDEPSVLGPQVDAAVDTITANATTTRNETVAANATDTVAAANATTNETTTAANATVGASETEASDAASDMFGFTPESLTKALTDFFFSFFDYFGAGTETNVIFNIWEQFTDSTGGWHG